MPGGGRLELATQRRGSSVAIAVTDSGQGMAPDIIARAFEPFFTTKEIGKGTGLGLSQVHGFVAQSGGTIEIESTPGTGTTVRLILPAAAAPGEDRANGGDGAPALAGGETVLLVEDEPLVRMMAHEMLETLGYTAIVAASAERALDELARHGTIDLLLTDIAMPGMNGRALADAARASRPALKVLLTTGYDPAGGEPGGLPVLAKPYLLEDLAAAVRRALAD